MQIRRSTWPSTRNATDAINLLAHGFFTGEEAGCRVLTTALDQTSELRPLHESDRPNPFQVTDLPFAECSVNPADVEAAMTPDARLMVMTHGNNVLGSVQEINRIGILHDNGAYFIVDGVQTAGFCADAWHSIFLS
jgi:cysteine desulfurase / selenocysteine lyase